MVAEKSENLIKRDFKADEPNKKWLTDTTEGPCNDGKLYIASIMDCFNGEIVGLAMADHMRKELCIQAFESACRTRNAGGILLHSDRGVQYARLEQNDMICSMSCAGVPYDNACAETFFSTIKLEMIYHEHFETRVQAQTAIF